MVDSVPPTNPDQPKAQENKDSVQFRKSSKYQAAQDFFPNMPMTKGEFHKFMSNLLQFICTQIKQDEAHMKEASERLKRSEEGEN